MSRSPTKAADFLKAMQAGEEAETPPPPQPANQPVTEPPPVQATPRPKRAKSAVPKRSELKHFGGYLDDESLEQIALLRIRLKKDNSQLIKLAIDDLFRKHTAKRAFGDA
jgi:hypothetical protein